MAKIVGIDVKATFNGIHTSICWIELFARFSVPSLEIVVPSHIPKCKNSEDLEPHKEFGIRPRAKAPGCLDSRG